VLVALLLKSAGDHDRCSFIVSFISLYLRLQAKPGLSQVSHNRETIYHKTKSLFFCRSISSAHKSMLRKGFAHYLGVNDP
jgi:hypothetical protein